MVVIMSWRTLRLPVDMIVVIRNVYPVAFDHYLTSLSCLEILDYPHVNVSYYGAAISCLVTTRSIGLLILAEQDAVAGLEETTVQRWIRSKQQGFIVVAPHKPQHTSHTLL